jgi:hypothetical protein
VWLRPLIRPALGGILGRRWPDPEYHRRSKFGLAIHHRASIVRWYHINRANRHVACEPASCKVGFPGSL